MIQISKRLVEQRWTEMDNFTLWWYIKRFQNFCRRSKSNKNFTNSSTIDKIDILLETQRNSRRAKWVSILEKIYDLSQEKSHRRVKKKQ